MEKNKKLLVQIPDEITRNKYFVTDSYTFAIYTYLKFKYFRNYKKEELEINCNELKKTLNIADNRTIKKSLLQLHKHGIILEYIDKMPTRKLLNITFVPEPFEMETFTQLPITILDKIEKIGCIGLRLLFYYESFINRTEPTLKQFACPAIETTASQLKINKETVIEYNRILHDNGLLLITKHEIKWDGSYTEESKPTFTKYNNHYKVMVNNI